MNKKFKRKTERLVVRPLSVQDYKAWKTAYTSMLPQKNEWDRATNRPANELTKTKFQVLLREQKQKRKAEEFCDYGIFLKNSGDPSPIWLTHSFANV